MPTLAGPFLLSAFSYSAAGIVFFLLLKPDPLLVARYLTERNAQLMKEVSQPEAGKNAQRIGIIVGAAVLVLTHIVMVAIMTMTPLHMQHHGNAMSAIGLTIGLHVAAMYLPSLITGSLVEKLGRAKMVVASAITLTFAGLLAAFAPGESTFLLTVALIMLGLGWNFGLISGTAIVIDSTTIQTRAKTQGSIDVGVALGGSIGSLLSGVIVAYSSYGALGFLGVYSSLLLIPLVVWASVKRRHHVERNQFLSQ